MQFAELNDVNLHYQVIGSPASRPLLVFANSLGTDFRIWRDVIVRLAGDYAILTYDMRGHGLSGDGRRGLVRAAANEGDSRFASPDPADVGCARTVGKR